MYTFHGKEGCHKYLLTKDEKLFEKKGLSVLEIWGVQVSEDLGSSEFFCSDLFIYLLSSWQ